MSKAVAPSSAPSDAPLPGLNTSTAIVLWLALTSLCPLQWVDTAPNALGMTVLVFNNLNILIALCEIALGIHIRFIQKDYQDRKERFKGKEWEGAFDYLFMPFSLSNLFSMQKWAIMWSTYSLWDPSYSNPESFGFFIDVGNGWSTIPPCILWNLAILFPSQLQAMWEYSWLLVGTLGIASYWQVQYGTFIYFLSFVYNRRYVGRPLVEVFGFVAFVNGIWIFFPTFALYAAVIILRDQDIVSIFR